MCGILVSVAYGEDSTSGKDLVPWINARGPDSLRTHKVRIGILEGNTHHFLELSFTSSVLHLRGKDVTVQPLVSESGDILCWNGEIWNGLEMEDNENDGLKLLEALTLEKQVWKVMEKVEGPWAMVYFSSSDRKLWYGRDCLGRRSLLKKALSESGGLVLSSVGVDMCQWEEVSVDGLWCVNLEEWVLKGTDVCTCSIHRF